MGFKGLTNQEEMIDVHVTVGVTDDGILVAESDFSVSVPLSKENGTRREQR